MGSSAGPRVREWGGVVGNGPRQEVVGEVGNEPRHGPLPMLLPPPPTIPDGQLAS